MISDVTARPTLLLIHGAWHGSWCWNNLRAALDVEGIESRTLDLPSAGGQSGIAEDARVIRGAIDALEGRPVVVVTHSYGGIPVSQAIAGTSNVVRVVYLAAFQLDVGESLLGYIGAPAASDPREMEPVPDDPRALFYADLPHLEAEEAVAHLVPQSARSFAEPLGQAGWRDVPSTYIVCQQDRALPAVHQEALATRAAEVYRMAGDHSPFLSKPSELAALLTKIALQSRPDAALG
ncbi:alpha/beta fold hydrolase [Streptomyces sp. NPDC051098]|uniref:alpha/beta fold hydrolase n=1 Tax=Streptomyces sp. NPDC051098 TaxID=3155411 RepID=UPI003435E4F8